MLYTLSDKILPAYFEDFAFGEHFLLHKSINPIPSRPIQALHFHKYLELGICLKGHGDTYIDNRCYRFTEGDVVVTPPDIPHLSVAEPRVQCVWHWISIEPLEMFRRCGFQNIDALNGMLQRSYCGVFHPWEHPRLTDLIRQISEVRLDGSETAILEFTFLTGQLLVECARIGDADDVEDKAMNTITKVLPALTYIRRNYADKEAVKEEQIAKICHMSISHFRATFKKETGMTVRDFIIQTRLATAAHLLMSTDYSVMNVAMESGFGQIACFNRIFSREFLETPTAFRKKFRMQIETDL